MKILLVEDEFALANVLAKGLKKCGYAVDKAMDGEEAIELHEINQYDVIVLDLNLPKLDGMEVLKLIRGNNKEINILILSARSEIENRIEGLDCGANDYLIKPFDFNELEARIRNLLRRSFKQQDTVLTCGSISIDTARKCAYADGQLIELTRKEYSLLQYLMLNKNSVISAERLIEHTWDSDTDLFSNSLKFHIYSLKKKLAGAMGDKNMIQNIRGQGYMISDSAGEHHVK
ncbi:response regulator transcription factor [Paenibacillus thiaminolyticus]|uniref:response regulator transcription factor n=1 Tax=Paenibacillus thiaminolyticus TaxID=49283 RepID=UPI002542B618|nr:response regulator transcription factor [Paenibacillus thiaminolyticus]WII37506.1 response regulator transcription factor [Paenibacillus thiaminolyticus]